MYKVLFIVILAIQWDYYCRAEIATANNQFGLRLYTALASEVEGDFSIAIFPLGTVFALLYARGENASTEILQYSGTPREVIQDYKRVVNDFQRIDILKSIRSLIVHNESISSEAVFEENLKALSIRNLLQDDFINITIQKIQRWLDNPETVNSTSKFLNENLDNFSRMKIVSKSFLNASWVEHFNPLFTKPSPFFYDETHSSQIETMFQRGDFSYADIPELDSTAIALPLKNTNSLEDTKSDELRIEFIILQPNSRTGLSKLEKKLQDFPFSLITTKFLEKKDLFLYVPKFNITTMLDLLPFIKQLDSTFTSFGEITNILNFSVFNCNELGTMPQNNNLTNTLESGSVVLPKKYIYNPHNPQSYRVNRPFIGFLYDQEKHIILNILRKSR